MADWYYARDGQQAGPLQLPELQALAAQGQLGGSDLVWTEGMPQWQPASQMPGVFPAPAAAEASPASFSPQAPQAAVAPYAYAQPASGIAYQTPYYAPPSRHSSLALTSMILSLVSLAVGGPFLALPGAICGYIALKGMKQTGDFRNKGFAQTGLWVGVGVTALFVCIILLVVILFSIGAAAAASGH